MLLDRILKKNPGTYGYYDDILIAVETEEEHDRILKAVFDSLLQAGMTLNRDKCKFNVTSVIFLGHLITESGVRPVPKKIQAIRNMPQPTNADQLRSFLHC